MRVMVKFIERHLRDFVQVLRTEFPERTLRYLVVMHHQLGRHQLFLGQGGLI